MRKMDAREAREKLEEIKFKAYSGQISMEEAYRLAEEPLKIYNDKAKEVAKKYGVRAKVLPNNLVCWGRR